MCSELGKGPKYLGSNWYTSNPCFLSSRSLIILSCNMWQMTAQLENLKPGKNSSVMHAPPTKFRLSSTRVFIPAFERYEAATSPLCPPPITIASYFADSILWNDSDSRYKNHFSDANFDKIRIKAK